MAGLSAKGRETADAVAWRETRHDLVSLVSAWVASVRRIVGDQGEDYYDDYFAYVSWREGIDKVIASVPKADASIIHRAAGAADAQFKNHTVDDGGKALSKFFRVKPEHWYWRRVPIRGPIARSLSIDETR
jgi:hypothetical protein